MPKNFEDRRYRMLRKAVFITLALILLVVLGRVVVEAFSFVAGNSGKKAEVSGTAYNLTGEGCPMEEDSTDCCEEACARLCSAKNRSLIKVGVIDPMKIKCGCVCSIEAE